MIEWEEWESVILVYSDGVLSIVYVVDKVVHGGVNGDMYNNKTFLNFNISIHNAIHVYMKLIVVVAIFINNNNIINNK